MDRALECASSFEEVHRALIASLPALKSELFEILTRGEKEKVAIARSEWPKLWLFLVRNHGEPTAADGLAAKAMQCEIGNPLTAKRMTRRTPEEFEASHSGAALVPYQLVIRKQTAHRL
jgi:hypothetical protein